MTEDSAIIERTVPAPKQPAAHRNKDRATNAGQAMAGEHPGGSGVRALLFGREVPPWMFSLAMHTLVLILLALISRPLQSQRTEAVTLDTRVLPEREEVDFPQRLDEQDVPADTLRTIGGTGVQSDLVGSSPAIQQTKVDRSRLPDADLTVSVAPIDLPGRETLTENVRLGLDGDIGAVVGDYGTALDRLSQEILRLLRESGKVLVVWLFDESGSMSDDQQEIKRRMDRVYRELGLVEESQGKALLTSVASFGKELHYQTREPTSNLDEIRAAIDQIPVDESGTENMCQAIVRAVQDHRKYFRQGKYRLAVVVLSDESGDDGDNVESALKAASEVQSPIYILGREAVFGTSTAQIVWRDPETGFGYWRPIRRGPETAFVEQLQTDGFQYRYRAHTSGFGPYEQTRLAGRTGGIMFILPHEETAVVEADNRQYAFLDMKEYVPTLLERREYVRERAAHPLRSAIWDVIQMLQPGDPTQAGNVSVPLRFPILPNEFASPAQRAEEKAVYVAGIFLKAHQRLQAVRAERAHEPSRRWRANYDLILGQLMAYRVRLFEYARHLNHLRRELPKPKNAKSNRLDVGTVAQIIPPDETLKIAGVTEEELLDAVQRSTAQLEAVLSEHPRTPWAARAQWELGRGFSVRLHEVFIDPRIATRRMEIKLPNL